MSSHLLALLEQWQPLKDATDWVLGTVYQTQGPAYRKAGSMMLFGGQGQQLGMLSGGCLESDIHRHARRAMVTGRALTLTYDGSDEDDIAFQLGIGCGGTIWVLLQPLSQSNDYLSLDRVYTALKQRRSCGYSQWIPAQAGDVCAQFEADTDAHRAGNPNALVSDQGGQWLHSRLSPPPHLLIVGGGIDARPVAMIGHQLGWAISVWDPRPANARAEHFSTADQLLSGSTLELADYVRREKVEAAILMTHNVALDAEALRALSDCKLRYWALLGPENRYRRVLEEAGVRAEALVLPLAGPAGLDIGGDLPETVALSILAECQAALKQCSGRSLSGVLAE